MLGLIILILVVAAMSAMMSTPEDRAAARERMKPVGRIMAIPALILVVWISLEVWWKSR